VVNNTLILWGSDFESRTRVTAPAALADLMPTVLTLLGVQRDPCGGACGRVLEESLRGPRNARLTPTRRAITTSSGSYRAQLRISSVAGHDYIDEGARER